MNEKIVYDPTKDKTPLDSAAIKNKIDNGELTVKGKNKPEKKHKEVVVPEEVHKALEEKAKAEGKTPDEKAAEIVEKKAKAKIEKKTSPFPADGKINKYGFLGFRNAWLADLGWKKGEDIAVTITRTAKGIEVEKA